MYSPPLAGLSADLVFCLLLYAEQTHPQICSIYPALFLIPANCTADVGTPSKTW